MELVIFAQSRRDNLFQIESHQVRNFLDSYSKRKFAAASLPAAPKLSEGQYETRTSLTERRLEQKAAGSATLRLEFCEHCSLNLRRSRARPCDVQLGPCNKRAPSAQLAAGLSPLCRRR